MLFEPPRVVDLKSAGPTDHSTPLALVESYNRSLRGSASDEQVLGFWNPDERRDIQKMMGDPEMQKRNRAFYASLDTMKVMAVLDFANESTVVVSYRGPAAIGVNAGKWFLTNKPAHDLTIAIAEAAFMDGIVKGGP